MALLKCLHCGGEYRDVLDDGMRYFHVCPQVESPIDGKLVMHPQARDENIIADPTGGPAKMRSPGEGVKVLMTDAEIEVAADKKRKAEAAAFKEAAKNKRRGKRAVEPRTDSTARPGRAGKRAVAVKRPAAGKPVRKRRG